MSPGTVVCRETDDVEEAAHVMEQKQIRRLPVLNAEKRMIGMLSLGDISGKAAEHLTSEIVHAVAAHHA